MTIRDLDRIERQLLTAHRKVEEALSVVAGMKCRVSGRHVADPEVHGDTCRRCGDYIPTKTRRKR